MSSSLRMLYLNDSYQSSFPSFDAGGQLTGQGPYIGLRQHGEMVTRNEMMVHAGRSEAAPAQELSMIGKVAGRGVSPCAAASLKDIDDAAVQFGPIGSGGRCFRPAPSCPLQELRSRDFRRKDVVVPESFEEWEEFLLRSFV